jgi:adenylyltransferase and sulfurtransferase
VETITGALAPTNARSLLGSYDVILDCTDNPASRYLLSDTAVLLGKPLVSGAAQRFDGQLCTYNLGQQGPCYRCLFPKPPSQEAAPTCEETGILGAVTGVIGSLQALEAIRIIVGLHGKSFFKFSNPQVNTKRFFFWGGDLLTDGQPSLLVYSALGMPPFRSVKLRKKRTTCSACGIEGQKVGKIEDTDYVQFCGGAKPDWVTLGLKSGHPEWRITANVGHLSLSLSLKNSMLMGT